MLRLLLLSLLGLVLGCTHHSMMPQPDVATSYLHISTTEIDSLLQTMTIEEKIGQLIVYQSNETNIKAIRETTQWIEDNHLGGILLKDIGIEKYLQITDRWHQQSKLPLFFATDETTSLLNQMSDEPLIPSLEGLAAIDSAELKRELQSHFEQQMDALGINLWLSAPLESTTLEKSRLTDHGYEFQASKIDRNVIRQIDYFENRNVLTVGNSFRDLHYLPRDTTGHLDSILYKYQMPIAAGLGGLQVDQQLLEIDTIERLPTFFVQQYLKGQLNFDGLLFGRHTSKDSLEYLFHAGVDVYLTSDYKKTFQFLKGFVHQGSLTEQILNRKVKKVLQAKTWINNGTLLPPDVADNEVAKPQFIKYKLKNKNKKEPLFAFEHREIIDYFNDKNWQVLSHYLFEKEIVLLNNPNAQIPFREIKKRDFKIFDFPDKSIKSFKECFSRYAYFTELTVKEKEGKLYFNPKSHLYSTNIFNIKEQDLSNEKYKSFIDSLNVLSNKAPVVVINYGIPENAQLFDANIVIIQLYDCNEKTQNYAAQLMFGGISAGGRLVDPVGKIYPAGTRNATPVIRIKYSTPEEVGIAAARLSSMDAILKSAIQSYVSPGGQIVVAKNGKIIYSKAFGYHTYQIDQKVYRNDLYDLASITKPAATTMMGMKLYEQKKISIQKPLRNISKKYYNKSIGWIKLRDLFTHKSGLQPNMPIYKYLSKSDTTRSLCTNYFCTDRKGPYQIKITDSLYFSTAYRDQIFDDVLELRKSRRRRSYRYSDVNFYLIQQILEEKSGSALNNYVENNIYEPLGLRHILFNPLRRYDKSQVVPTQNDKNWRHQLVDGTVHDETAALLGGVAGNAGLFGNAEDIAVLFQMLLNGGTYGGVRLFEEETVRYFTGKGHGNHRGLGFDKPTSRKTRPYARSASSNTFGHTGFTGTCVWADPDQDLVFVFLNNRIHPNVHNTKLTKYKTRSRLHQIVYDALNTYQFEMPHLGADS